jgi:hypothetical protein
MSWPLSRSWPRFRGRLRDYSEGSATTSLDERSSSRRDARRSTVAPLNAAVSSRAWPQTSRGLRVQTGDDPFRCAAAAARLRTGKPRHALRGRDSRARQGRGVLPPPDDADGREATLACGRGVGTVLAAHSAVSGAGDALRRRRDHGRARARGLGRGRARQPGGRLARAACAAAPLPLAQRLGQRELLPGGALRLVEHGLPTSAARRRRSRRSRRIPGADDPRRPEEDVDA